MHEMIPDTHVQLVLVLLSTLLNFKDVTKFISIDVASKNTRFPKKSVSVTGNYLVYHCYIDINLL